MSLLFDPERRAIGHAILWGDPLLSKPQLEKAVARGKRISRILLVAPAIIAVYSVGLGLATRRPLIVYGVGGFVGMSLVSASLGGRIVRARAINTRALGHCRAPHPNGE